MIQFGLVRDLVRVEKNHARPKATGIENDSRHRRPPKERETEREEPLPGEGLFHNVHRLAPGAPVGRSAQNVGAIPTTVFGFVMPDAPITPGTEPK